MRAVESAQGRPAVHSFKAPCGCRCRNGPCQGDRHHARQHQRRQVRPDALPDNPGKVFADSAYRGNHFGEAVRAKGGTPRVATCM